MSSYIYDTDVIQHDTIAVSGTYAITAYGAEGGDGHGTHNAGGVGVEVSGDIYLTAGTVLDIVVGGAGVNGGSAGGGGGFIFETGGGGDVFLAVADVRPHPRRGRSQRKSTARPPTYSRDGFPSGCLRTPVIVTNFGAA